MKRIAFAVALFALALRLNAAVYTVSSTADSGAGTLRQAILDANASAGADEIHFAIGTGAQTILLTSDAPAISDPVTLDGTTQPGYAGTPIIMIESQNTTTATFTLNAGNSTIRGLWFVYTRVLVQTGDSNLIAGNIVSAAVDRCGLSVTSSNNIIGGTTSADRNVFNSSNGFGACIGGTNNAFKGNYVGLTTSGADASGNKYYGMSVGGTGNVIGGTEAGARNVISGNRGTGLALGGSQNSVKGNYIGVAPDGVTAMRNGASNVNGLAGIEVSGSNNVIGGLEAGAGNIIANNPGPGIDFVSTTAVGDAILSNSIYNNYPKGIDLTHPNVQSTPANDALDADSGPNGVQNYPTICSTVQNGQNVDISGRLHSTPSTQFTIQFFSNSPTTGTCQGASLMGTITVTTNANGDAAFTASMPGTATSLITATATDAANNTSELAPCTRCTAVSDFNGDGKSDVFWRNTTTGENALWFLDSRTVIGGGNLPPAPPDWTAYLGDFNADGRTDIFWRNTANGGTGLWYLNGATFTGGGNIPSMATDWVPLVGDFTGDGRADLLWRNVTTGAQEMWAARFNTNGFDVLGSAPTTASGAWERRAGMLNGDSNADVFWRFPSSGQNSLWFMSGRSVIGGANLPTAGSDWTPSFGDSSGDGRSDILWRHGTTGELAFWFLSGGSIIGGGNLPPVGSPWIMARGDYDGNGRLDILWRSPSDGENTIWFLNGTSIIGGGPVPTVPGSQWIIVGNQ